MLEFDIQPPGWATERVSHLDQYFGPWAMESATFQALATTVRARDLGDHIAKQLAEPQVATDISYPVLTGGIAMIQLSGTLMKYGSSLMEAASTVRARRQVRNALVDDSIAGIALVIDSPGGTVSGIPDLADDVARASKEKPVYAYIEDRGASAAYYVASQANKVFANANALIGSIGVFLVVEDSSAFAESEGIKVHVLRTGEFKGAGTPGTEVTEEHLTEFQATVDKLGNQFNEAVARGRRMGIQVVQALADGRVYVGADAIKVGLIDGIKPFELVLEDLREETNRERSKTKMATETTADTAIVAETPSQEPVAATYQELKAAVPQATADFLCDQLERKATADEAKGAWMAHQAKEIEELKAKASKPGVDALGSEGGDEEEATNADAIDRWESAIGAHLAKGKRHADAIKAARKADPELHKAYVVAYNERQGNRKGALAFAEREI